MEIRLRLTRLRLAVLVLTGAMVAGTIAYAAIPDGGGVINACYRVGHDDRKGDLRIVGDPGACTKHEAPISWSQRGEQGFQGEPGPQGETGPQGPQGPAGNLSLAGEKCPPGHFVTGFDSTGDLVCSGAAPDPGPSTPPSAPVLEVFPAPTRVILPAAELVVANINNYIDELNDLYFPPGLGLPHMAVPSSIVDGQEYTLRVTASEPGSTLEFFASADCAVGMGWLSVLIDELQTGVPGGLEVFASVAQLLAPFLQHVFEAEVDDLRMPEEGVLEIPVMFFDSFDAFSARAINAAGTSACSNAVTAP